MEPVVLDREAFNTFWTVYLALLALCLYEWAEIAGPVRDAKTCDKHPGTESCVHRNRKYNERRKK